MRDDITVLADVDGATGLPTAALLPGKTLTGHALSIAKNFLMEFGRAGAILQSDSEPAVRLLLQK
eukprot:8415870-Alexandrium_andersonii.AAC.1